MTQAKLNHAHICAESLSDAASLYSRYGAVVMKNVISSELIGEYVEEIHGLIRLRLTSLGCEATGELDEDFNRLCELGRNFGGEIFDVVRNLDGFYKLIRDPGLLATVKALLPSDTTLQMPFGPCQFRIDRPSEDRFLLNWHQDYTYNLMGTDAVTAWIPLTTVDSAMGPIRIFPDETREIARVKRLDTGWAAGKGGGGKVFEYPDINPQYLEDGSFDVPVQKGDVLFFDALLMHRSGFNTSEKTRWIVNPRYGNLSSADIVDRGYLCGHLPQVGFRDIFKNIHPELAID